MAKRGPHALTPVARGFRLAQLHVDRKPRLSIQELGERLGVSKATVKRDLAALRALGVIV